MWLGQMFLMLCIISNPAGEYDHQVVLITAVTKVKETLTKYWNILKLFNLKTALKLEKKKKRKQKHLNVLYVEIIACFLDISKPN